MQLVQELGTRIETRWAKHNFDERAFPEIAADMTQEARLHEEIGADQVIRWFSTTSSVPPQVGLDSGFGEPPLTLFAGRHMYIEALFWVDGTTSIHQHSFSGAFQVLVGKSIHSRYRFHPRHRVSSRMLIGDIQFERAELLRRGDCRTISSGPAFIHSLFHLDRPSVSLVVRTFNDPETPLQYSYLRPFIAVDAVRKAPHLVQQQRIIRYLTRVEHPDRLEICTEMVRRADMVESFHLLEAFLEENLDDRDALSHLAGLAERAHPTFTSVLEPVLAERRRELDLFMHRQTVRAPDLRFFLALLLNLPERTSIEEMVRAHQPERAPVDVIAEWIQRLSQVPADGDGPRSSPFELGPGELTVLRYLLEAPSMEVALARLCDTYDTDGIDGDLRRLCDALTGSPLLRPLFVH